MLLSVMEIEDTGYTRRTSSKNATASATNSLKNVSWAVVSPDRLSKLIRIFICSEWGAAAHYDRNDERKKKDGKKQSRCAEKGEGCTKLVNRTFDGVMVNVRDHEVLVRREVIMDTVLGRDERDQTTNPKIPHITKTSEKSSKMLLRRERRRT